MHQGTVLIQKRHRRSNPEQETLKQGQVLMIQTSSQKEHAEGMGGEGGGWGDWDGEHM